jgi:bacterioferritin
MDHAVIIGEKITSLGGHPEIAPAEVEETNVHSIDQLLEESLAHEQKALALYKRLVKLAGADIALEELARGFVRAETEHVDEVKKMLLRH